MVAQAYEPLVRLPGLPPEGPLSLSQYIVGLYNFLLSIVGIVAVMMLIIGGMKYIAAAGNASVIADAKDTISNAIFGLLLALLSWVIVSTINPDVLYIKNPASSLTDAYEGNLDACGIYVDPVCTCKDTTTPAAVDQATCEVACADNCGTTGSLPCIYGGSSEKTIRGRCTCVDKVKVISLAPAGTSCNEICQDSALVTDGGYHCLVADARIGVVQNSIASYTEDELKKLAIHGGNVSAVQDQRFIVNVEDYSTGLNLPLRYFVDGDGDGDCIPGDPTDPELINPISGLADGWASFIASLTIPAVPACQHSQTPKAESCVQRFCVQDSEGNVSYDSIYWLILDDPNIPPNIP